MYHPQAAIFDHLESTLAIGLFVEKRKLERRRLTGLLREAEMNIRLRELEKSREEAGKRLPAERIGSVADTPPPASFAEATAAVVKPAAPTQIASGAKKLSDLAKQRLAFNSDLNTSIDAYAKKMADAGRRKAAIFTKANAAIDDELAGFDSLDNALTEFEGANGSPLPG